MAEYIEKQAAIDEVDEWYDLYPDSDTAREALSLLKKAIKKISPEDVRLVVRGRWIPDSLPGGGLWVCSNCKFPSEAFAADRLYKFCPNCGVDMRGGDAE